MTREEQIERVASELATGLDGRPHRKLAERIVAALAQPVERAETAEAAARGFAQTLVDIAALLSAVDCLYAPGWARTALARHPGFAPAGESSQDVPVVNQ